MRLALALLVLMPSVASADALAIHECAGGWRSTNTGHSVYCAPIPCASDSECGGGTCGEVARCMRTQRMDIGNGIETNPPATYEEPTSALCGADGSCSDGAHCMHARECSPPPASGCAVDMRARAPGGSLSSSAWRCAADSEAHAFRRARRRALDRSRVDRGDRS